MGKRILVVEDEPAILKLVAYNLERDGFEVAQAADGPAALKACQLDPFDLILLDIMLPGLDGLEVFRRLRTSRPEVPVVFLTARDAEVDRIVGLELGADDYITKPFSPRELVARVKAVLRRAGRGAPAEGGGAMVRGDLRIDLNRHEVTRAGEGIALTPTEFSLLTHLARHPGRVYTRATLLDAIWGIDFAGDTRTVDMHISNLRDKLEPDPARPRYIVTVRGVGYRLEGEP
ncbi:MAG: response regulator transcription factor [Bacillota bacterium]